MTTQTTIETLATEIATQALEQGLSHAGLSRYELTADDERYIRDEYPSDDYPSDAIHSAEWRTILTDVEQAVRACAVPCLDR